MSNLKNTNLKIAEFAMGCVEDVIENGSIESDKYKTLAKKMSTLIQQNGFIGTLVFNLSKINKTHHKEVLKNIIEWTNKNDKICDIKDFKNKNINFEKVSDIDVFTRYIEWIISLNQREYRLITKEMMNLFAWIKRFADGMIEGE